jgi:hypothetical protein
MLNADTSSKQVLFLIAIIIFIFIGFQYKKIVIDQDFTVNGSLPCDTVNERCFTKSCPETQRMINCDNAPYKKISITATFAPKCLFEEKCGSSFECSQYTKQSCVITYCSKQSIEGSEKCTEKVD